MVVVIKNPPAKAGETRDVGGPIPGSGRSPGVGNGSPLQYSCLENPMDRGAWWTTVHGITKSCTWLRTHTHTPDYTLIFLDTTGFPSVSVGKESACNAGDLCLIPGLGWWEVMATHSGILAWRIPMDRGAGLTTVHGVAESQIHRATVTYETLVFFGVWWLINVTCTASYVTFNKGTKRTKFNKEGQHGALGPTCFFPTLCCVLSMQLSPLSLMNLTPHVQVEAV